MDEMTLVELKDELKDLVLKAIDLTNRDDVEAAHRLMPRSLELIHEINRRSPGTFPESRVAEGERLYAKGVELFNQQ